LPAAVVVAHNQNLQVMKKPAATQIFGGLALVVGALWIWGIFLEPLIGWLRSFGTERAATPDHGGEHAQPSLGWLFRGLLFLFFSAVGGALIYCGIGLMKNPPIPEAVVGESFPEDDVRRAQLAVDPVVDYVRIAAGVLGFSAVAFLASPVESWLASMRPELESQLELDSVAFYVGVSLILPFYVFLVYRLLRSRYTRVELRCVIGRRMLLVIAILLGAVLHELVGWVWPDGGARNINSGLRETVLRLAYFLGPGVIAVLFYWIAAGALRYRELELDLRRMGVRVSGDKP